MIIERNQTINCNEVSCPSDYQCQKESGLCIRSDIVENKLTCMQVGCPIVEGHDYYCTSSGFCAETIFVPKKCQNSSECPDDFVCQEESGLCIRTQIETFVKGCSSSDNCVIPCPGIKAECINSVCNYKGTCELIKYGCKQAGCDEGSTCNKDTNVCEKKVEIIKEVKKIPIWIFPVSIGFVIVMFVILGIVLFRRKKA